MNDSEGKKPNYLVIFLLLALIAAAYLGFCYRTQRDYYRHRLDENGVQYIVPNAFKIAPNE